MFGRKEIQSAIKKKKRRTHKVKSRLLTGILVMGLCFGCTSLQNASAAQTVTACRIKTTGSYRHPVTKKIADPGNNEGLGQGMVDNIVAKSSLYEKDAKGQLYVTVRLGMMDQITKVRFFTQKRGTSSWQRTTAMLMQENVDNNYKNDYRFRISGKTDIVKVQFYVTAMGRDVIFFLSFGNTVNGTADFVVSVKKASSSSTASKSTKASSSSPASKSTKASLSSTASKSTKASSSSTASKSTKASSSSIASKSTKASSSSTASKSTKASSSSTTVSDSASGTDNIKASSNNTSDTENAQSSTSDTSDTEDIQSAVSDSTDAENTTASQKSGATDTAKIQDGEALISQAQGLVTSKEITEENSADSSEASAVKEAGKETEDSESADAKDNTSGGSSFSLSWTFFWQCILIIIIPALVVGGALSVLLYVLQYKGRKEKDK